MVKKVFFISIMVIALAAGRTYSAQNQRGSDQPAQNPWGQGQPAGVPTTNTGQDGAQKGEEKDRTLREIEEDQRLEEKKKSDERMALKKNNTLLIMKGIVEITQGLARMMEKDMSRENMTKIVPLMKDISVEMAEMQNILSKERASEDEIVTLRLKIEVTRKRMEQLK